MARARSKIAAPAPPLDDGFEIEMWPIDRPTPYPQNVKDHTDEAIDKLVRIIRRVGLQVAIVVDEAGVIAKGHKTWLACKKLGRTVVPVKVARGVAPAEIRAWRLADNRSVLDSLWDEGNLGLEMEAIEDAGVPLSATGFEDDEIARILGRDAGGIEPLDVLPLPTMTWVLIGIPTVRFPEVSELVDQLMLVPDALVEMTANDRVEERKD